MKSFNDSSICITGVGVTAAIGQGKQAFSTALLKGDSCFDILAREGRQHKSSCFLGAEIGDIDLSHFPAKLLRTISYSAQVALATLREAYDDANLADVNPKRIGLIIGGSNFQQREMFLTFERYRNKPEFIRPNHAVSFMDSDLCGIATEQFTIQGFAHTVGGASASGQLAIIKAAEAVASGQVDVCIALGAMMDLSYLELQAFRTLGAMGSTHYAESPQLSARPFDKNSDGFIFGESCGAVVIEHEHTALARKQASYANVLGWATAMDAHRNPDPSLEGEMRVIKQSLKMSGLSAGDIDYINPHGTGSTIGDETELEAFRQCQLGEAYINTSKSILGHGLSAAGCVEVIATLMQMKYKKLHPSRNLEDPIDESFNWVKSNAVDFSIQRALSMSMGFGGINTALCLQSA